MADRPGGAARLGADSPGGGKGLGKPPALTTESFADGLASCSGRVDTWPEDSMASRETLPLLNARAATAKSLCEFEADVGLKAPAGQDWLLGSASPRLGSEKFRKVFLIASSASPHSPATQPPCIARSSAAATPWSTFVASIVLWAYWWSVL